MPCLLEMNLFKWLFPFLFLCFMAPVHADSEGPDGPVYDPQGRLIPYDAKKPHAAPAVKNAPVRKAKAGKKLKRGKRHGGSSRAVTRKSAQRPAVKPSSSSR